MIAIVTLEPIPPRSTGRVRLESGETAQVYNPFTSEIPAERSGFVLPILIDVNEVKVDWMFMSYDCP